MASMTQRTRLQVKFLLTHWVVQEVCSDGVGLYSAEVFRAETSQDCILWALGAPQGPRDD